MVNISKKKKIIDYVICTLSDSEFPHVPQKFHSNDYVIRTLYLTSRCQSQTLDTHSTLKHDHGNLQSNKTKFIEHKIPQNLVRPQYNVLFYQKGQNFPYKQLSVKEAKYLNRIH